MQIQGEMKRLLDEVPGLHLVAFGDLSSGLILDSVAKTAFPREVLDLLGEKAVECFAMLRQVALPDDADPAVFGASVIHFSERGARIFARHQGAADDVICAICDPGVELEPLLQSVSGLARTIGGQE
jgi:hypothetical protein